MEHRHEHAAAHTTQLGRGTTLRVAHMSTDGALSDDLQVTVYFADSSSICVFLPMHAVEDLAAFLQQRVDAHIEWMRGRNEKNRAAEHYAAMAKVLAKLGDQDLAASGLSCPPMWNETIGDSSDLAWSAYRDAQA